MRTVASSVLTPVNDNAIFECTIHHNALKVVDQANGS